MDNNNNKHNEIIFFDLGGKYINTSYKIINDRDNFASKFILHFYPITFQDGIINSNIYFSIKIFSLYLTVNFGLNKNSQIF